MSERMKRLPTETMEEFLARVNAPSTPPETVVEVEACCGVCRFFYAPRLQCRKYAPVVTPRDTTETSGTGWPAVAPGDCCGEFSLTPNEKE